MCAVIWIEKSGKRYVTLDNRAPTNEDIELAKKYDSYLKKKITEIEEGLSEKGFFSMKPGLKKWYVLGEKLQFLEDSELRKKCDPDLENTFRAFYDLAQELSPTGKMPLDKSRLIGDRNHFKICYRLAKFPWGLVKDFTWREWNDIYMSFTTYNMWADKVRLLEWLVQKSREKTKINNKRLRKALITVRNALGEKSDVERDTSVLTKKELFALLNKNFEALKF